MQMKKRLLLRLFLIVLTGLILVSAATAISASNTVPASRLDDVANAITANALKPSSCSALNLAKIVVCSGVATCTGTNSKELILGTANAEIIQGRGGTDCILGGGGDDQIVGNGASDVCIGGPGNDTFSSCETQIQ